MNLKPEDVEQVKFRVALRGYAEDEVDVFLDQVTDTIRDLNRRLDAAQREAQQLREREALLLQRRDPEPPAPATPPLLPEEQPPLPVMPEGEEGGERVEPYDLPTQVIEPEQAAGEEEPPSAPERPQWGGYSY